MARETKQDRIVRTTVDQVIEHLHEFKMMEVNPSCKEMDVERWVQSFLRSCLGYASSAGYVIRAQETKGKMRPDLIVMKNDKPIFVVEVKRLGFDLDKSDFRCGKVQLAEYLNHIGNVRWGLLTNGVEWKLFDFSQPQYGGIETTFFDLRLGEDVVGISKRSAEELCYEFMDLHEASYSSQSWEALSKEALAFSPESLARAILSTDVIRYIARSIKGEHAFKACHEILTDKVHFLLENGLDDSVAGWNEAKNIELQKFIKSQKRAARRTKRSRKAEADGATTSVPTEKTCDENRDRLDAAAHDADKKSA